jgi:N-acetylated-alpha-linked acidic dipeptidase
MDVAVSGPRFGASSVPSLKQFLRDVTKSVPSPQGGTLYAVWRKATPSGAEVVNPQEAAGTTFRPPAAQVRADAAVGDLGSGSDYTVFLQHLGVPSTDIGSTGPYGVYHSVFDNFNWFKKFGDPDFAYEQEMARVFGLEAVRMADADVLPYNYEEYGKEIRLYIEAARKKAETKLDGTAPDFSAATSAAKSLEEAGSKILEKQKNPPADPTQLNRVLRDAESGLLIPEGLPHRPWYHHAIYAPGQYTGYAAVVIPGVNEAIDAGDADRARQQIAALAAALHRAAGVLESSQ